MSNRENLIKINHVGFLKNSPKYFVYKGETHSGEFVVEYLKDTLYTEDARRDRTTGTQIRHIHFLDGLNIYHMAE